MPLAGREAVQVRLLAIITAVCLVTAALSAQSGADAMAFSRRDLGSLV